jgi:hypothetical protein
MVGRKQFSLSVRHHGSHGWGFLGCTGTDTPRLPGWRGFTVQGRVARCCKDDIDTGNKSPRGVPACVRSSLASRRAQAAGLRLLGPPTTRLFSLMSLKDLLS